MFTIIIVYHEFCDLAFVQRFYYELGAWEEEFSMFRLGQLSIKELDEEDLIYNFEEDEAANQAFWKLVEKERNKVIKCLYDNIDNILGRETTVFVAMYLTCFTPNDEEDENLKINDKKMSDYEYFEKLIEKYYDDILNHLDFDEEEAFGWLSEETYKIR